MSLADEQEAFLRLATDAAEQARFLADPGAVGVSWGLTPATIKHLQAQWPAIIRFGRSLRNKRREEVASLLPHTKRVLGDAFREWFDHYCADEPGAGQRCREEESYRFAEYVAARTQDAAVRYEAGLLRLRAQPRFLSVRRLGRWSGVAWCCWRGRIWQWPRRIRFTGNVP